jgi:hypothetical protein
MFIATLKPVCVHALIYKRADASPERCVAYLCNSASLCMLQQESIILKTVHVMFILSSFIFVAALARGGARPATSIYTPT